MSTISREHTLNTSHGAIAVKEWSDGPIPVVMIHGNLGIGQRGIAALDEGAAAFELAGGRGGGQGDEWPPGLWCQVSYEAGRVLRLRGHSSVNA